ncbi:TraR/DksA family transcriptional regulator [Citrobacter amalonaticus]|uniref:TraR/DksA family transcriptional regulator n=1 Tax=Citrobacter amalonaticus TaxID=35703 RepID=UPI00300C93C9
MVDEIDRDQAFNEQSLQTCIDKIRSCRSSSPSQLFCVRCAEPIPEKRRQLIPGVSLCVSCQQEAERQG